MMFSNTPFSVGEDGKRKGRRNQVVPAWRYSFVVCLVMVDLAVMLISLSISLWANDAAYNAINEAMPFWLFLICFSLIWVLSLTFAGTYHRHVMAEGYELYAKIINASLLTIITYCSLAFIFNLSLPRTALIVAPIIAFFLEVIARWQMRQWQHRSRQKGACKYKTVVVGSSDGINCALRTMRDYSNWGYSPIAVCPIEADDNEKDAYVVTSFEPDPSIEGADKLKVIPFNAAFPRTCESLGAQEVYVADVLSRDSEMLHGISLAVESLGMELALAVSLADVSGHRLYLRNTAEQPVLLASLPQYTNTTYVIKRLLDIVGSAFALLISSPLMLGTAIAIKLDDGGPIFFSQQRIGLHGKPFTMYKFRSMVTNAEELKKKLAEENGQTDRFIFKMKDDPRITKVGRFIRKTSLDEFPQFFNVLKGDMSLVGPRPALRKRLPATVPFIPRDCWLSLVLPVRGRFPAVRIFRRNKASIWTFPTLKIGPLQAILRFSQKQCSWSSAAPDLTKFRSTFRTNRRANQSAPSRSALLLSHVVQMGNVFLCGCDLACLIVGSLVS